MVLFTGHFKLFSNMVEIYRLKDFIKIEWDEQEKTVWPDYALDLMVRALVLSCPFLSFPVLSTLVLSCHVMSCHVMSCHVISCYILSHDTSCYAMLRSVMLCSKSNISSNFMSVTSCHVKIC